MMKKTLLLIAILFINVLFSQDKTRDEVLQLIAEDSCLCIQEDDTLFDDSKTMNQKQMTLGVCLLRSYNERKKECAELANKGMNDFEALGEEVGLKMGLICGEAFINLFSDEQLGALINEEDAPDIPPPPATKNENDLNIQVTLISLNNDAISYITVTDSYDKEHTFIVSEQFEGYEFLIKSNLKKDFRVFYNEVNYFDLSERRYLKKKVIKYLEKI